MVAHSLPEKIRDLRKIGYEVLPIREELRNNLMTKIRNDEPVFPGIVGFEETVLPQVENAILAGQDIILLGERGQAKSRLVRSLVNLLDESVPIIAGCEINDNPLNQFARVAGIRSQTLEMKQPWNGYLENVAIQKNLLLPIYLLLT